MRGYAVVDIETTGFSYKHGHRIVEIGVVELSPEGAVQDSWETLINPQRHITRPRKFMAFPPLMF